MNIENLIISILCILIPIFGVGYAFGRANEFEIDEKHAAGIKYGFLFILGAIGVGMFFAGIIMMGRTTLG
jgi:hypothetical protein